MYCVCTHACSILRSCIEFKIVHFMNFEMIETATNPQFCLSPCPPNELFFFLRQDRCLVIRLALRARTSSRDGGGQGESLNAQEVWPEYRLTAVVPPRYVSDRKSCLWTPRYCYRVSARGYNRVPSGVVRACCTECPTGTSSER